MINFALEELKDEYPIWAAHHRKVGIHVKREYKDGTIVSTKDEEVLSLSEKHSNLLLKKSVDVYNKTNDSITQASDYFLPLENLDYKEAITSFQVGASNTKQTLSIRYKFLIEESVFYFERVEKVSGSFSLINFLDRDDLEESLLETASNSDVRSDGLGISEDDEDSINIVVVDAVGDATIIEIEVEDLIDHLVGFEVFDYNMEIL